MIGIFSSTIYLLSVMAKTIHIRLTGLAESFMNEMTKEGLTEEDVISQALGIMAEVWRTGAVARVNRQEQLIKGSDSSVDFYYGVQTPSGTKTAAPPMPSPPAPTAPPASSGETTARSNRWQDSANKTDYDSDADDAIDERFDQASPI